MFPFTNLPGVGIQDHWTATGSQNPGIVTAYLTLLVVVVCA